MPSVSLSRSLPGAASLVLLLSCGGGGGGGGGGIAVLPPPTTAPSPADTPPATGAPPAPAPQPPVTQPPAPDPRPATMQSPAPDSKLDGGRVAFGWAANDGDDYALDISAPGATTPLFSGSTSATSLTAPGLPTDGSPLAVTLRTRKNGTWLPAQRYAYTAAGYTAAQSTAAAKPWTDPIPLPLVPASAANLPDGKLLLWAGRGTMYFGSNSGTATYTSVFDPATRTATPAVAINPGHEMFCQGLSLLADGGVMVTGGSDAGMTSIYDPASGAWTQGAPLNVPRAYHASTTMSDGSVFTVGGSWNGGTFSKMGEVWSSTTRTWRQLSGVPAHIPADATGGAPNPPLAYDDATYRGQGNTAYYRADNHMWLFGAAGGWVFHGGPSKAMHWIDTRGNGAVVQAGLRGDDDNAMTAGAVMYDAGKILKLGGSPNHDAGPAHNSAYLIDISAGPPKPATVRKLSPMAYRRTFVNSVVLPNGEVIVIGGQTQPVGFSDAYGVLAAELWNPATESFITLPPMQKARNYHSIALLLLDGRVLSGGGGLCDCAGDHPDAEIYTPPYLLAPDGSPAPRPALTAAPAAATWGETIAVKTDRAVSRFALVRMASATHSVNTDQRRIPVGFTGTAGAYALSIPADRGIVLPGNYMLFALDAQGVPSVARTVNIR